MAHIVNENRRRGGKRFALARHAGSRDQVDEASGIFGDELPAAEWAGWRREEHGVQTLLAHSIDVRLRLFHADIGQQTTIDAMFGGRARQVFQPEAKHGIQVREQHERNFGMRADLRRDIEHFA